MNTKDHISVCVCTYNRNELLERLLRNLAIQRTEGMFEYSIVVIDNDKNGHAKEIISKIKNELNLDLIYEIEPEKGIPPARNHAVRIAKGNYIAFIDDDEFPPPYWLLKMYEGIKTFNVDGVLGPVYPYFDESPPSWLIKSGLCELPSYRTGTLLHWSKIFTNNVLVKKDIFTKYKLIFDHNFRTGGSDQELFRQAMKSGCKFIAIKEATVYEVISPKRWTRKYWIKRALVNGYNNRKYTLENKNKTWDLLLSLKSAIAVIIYTLILPICFFLGNHKFIVCIERCCWHLSRICACFGIELWKKRDF
jgi:glycosyltransferase involved in cell wall biosynthesis